DSCAHARDSGAGHPAGRVFDFRLCGRGRQSRLVPTGTPGLRTRRRTVQGVWHADPENYRDPARDPLLPALPTAVAAASARARAISSATSTTAFISRTS